MLFIVLLLLSEFSCGDSKVVLRGCLNPRISKVSLVYPQDLMSPLPCNPNVMSLTKEQRLRWCAMCLASKNPPASHGVCAIMFLVQVLAFCDWRMSTNPRRATTAVLPPPPTSLQGQKFTLTFAVSMCAVKLPRAYFVRSGINFKVQHCSLSVCLCACL